MYYRSRNSLMKWVSVIFPVQHNAQYFQFLFIKYLMGPTVATNNYHVGVVRSQLTKNLLNLFDNLWEEIQVAFNDNIPRTDGASIKESLTVQSDSVCPRLELSTRLSKDCTNSGSSFQPDSCWTASLYVLFMIHHPISRSVIGREEEYLRVNIDFTMDVDKGRKTLVRTPTFLRP